MINKIYIALIPLLPLFSFLLLALFGKKVIKNLSGTIGTLSLGTAALIALITSYNYFFAGNTTAYESLILYKFNWLPFTENISIDMGIMLDPIAAMMIVVVTFISFLVHLFSLGYMKGEERYPAYFAYLSLFTFSMLGLVLSSNIFQMYIFWELVGVSSYLLIGFYFTKPSAVAASKKAFIVTRFADLGFLIGILLLSFYSETLDFNTLIERLTTPGDYLSGIATASFLGISALTWGLTLVFIGGAGKSAMFPLHVWLPDAMEGPTPVSALIHAATMVVAGVFLVARLFPVFAISCPVALDIVAGVGAFSSLFAAVIACTQTDIKRVLAYSTMSQIGYMMFALGVSGMGNEGLGYMASMFHLFTHAIFKALLFLGAGVIIHYVHSNETTDMGGLRKFLPVTHITFLLACLAIAGIPPFAGFFSKEEILVAAFESNKLVFAAGIITAGLTAFYMFRLYFLIFWNKEPHSHGNHEGSKSMLLPLIILGAGTVTAGFMPFSKMVTTDGSPIETHFHLTFTIIAVSVSLIGIIIAALLYRKETKLPELISKKLTGFYRMAYHKFFIDEIYLFVTKGILFNVLGAFAAWFDKKGVDGVYNSAADVAENTSESVKDIQSGKVQHYALLYFTGLLLIAFVYIFFIR